MRMETKAQSLLRQFIDGDNAKDAAPTAVRRHLAAGYTWEVKPTRPAKPRNLGDLPLN